MKNVENKAKNYNYERDLKSKLKKVGRDAQVMFLYKEFNGNLSKISEFTGISRSTIYKIIEKSKNSEE